MNTTKPVVCIFPHYRKDEDIKSTGELLGFLKYTFPGELQGRYFPRHLEHTRKFEGKSLGEIVIKGSLILFSMQGRVWGAGFVRHGIEEIPGKDAQYKFAIDLYPETIRSYDRGIAIQDIQRATGCDLTRGWLRASYLVLGYTDTIEQKLIGIMDLPERL